MVAALSFLDPELAERALLILGTSDELPEGFVCLVRVSADLEFLAGLPYVIVSTARQAVPLLAYIAREVVAIDFRIKYEAIIAIGTWAP